MSPVTEDPPPALPAEIEDQLNETWRNLKPGDIVWWTEAGVCRNPNLWSSSVANSYMQALDADAKLREAQYVADGWPQSIAYEASQEGQYVVRGERYFANRRILVPCRATVVPCQEDAFATGYSGETVSGPVSRASRAEVEKQIKKHVTWAETLAKAKAMEQPCPAGCKSIKRIGRYTWLRTYVTIVSQRSRAGEYNGRIRALRQIAFDCWPGDDPPPPASRMPGDPPPPDTGGGTPTPPPDEDASAEEWRRYLGRANGGPER